MKKKFYLIYQITNNVNGKIYIGKHETNNLDDDYFGSGKHLINAQNKYGLENFTKTILFYCSSREEMNLLEHYVVTPEFCQRDDVYNLNEGGNGGWYAINQSRSNNPELKAKQLYNWVHGNKDYCHTNDFSKAVSTGLKAAYSLDHSKCGMLGKKHTDLTKKKMSKIKKDLKHNVMKQSIWIFNTLTLEIKIWPKNIQIPNDWNHGRKPHIDTRNKNASAYGHVWINNLKENKFVKNELLQEFLNNGWNKGRIKDK